MRTITFVTAAVFSIGYAVPASAQVYSYANCQSLAEQRDATIGWRVHREFMRECMAGKIPMSVASQTPTVRHVLDAESFGYCNGLAEQRGSTEGQRVYREFIRECMEGQIPAR
jgi:hypothetical protein